jgi:hypothetical protein
MNDFYASTKDSVGIYAADVHVAASRGGVATGVVAAGWIAVPFGLQTLLHPGDAITLQLKLQGIPVPSVLTAQQMVAGFVEAAIALGVLVLIQLVCTVLFYRRAKLGYGKITRPALWPLAALTAGVLGNGAWLYATGAFDLGGCLIGFSSAVLTVGGEIMCAKLGKEFVFGPPNAVQVYG